ncbi:hypothetical protein OU415_02520 [Saccharopolyspora sp. WRP15-2]|uniref:Uncharacterized protein n=1 Tax=Saccharopolyspora oryzae TaxID=2997343 RepID=A0ABT4URE4_9PSEU|nr:hypothetical protein [Saccharopolyspora oryzae]MDA3624292.1 hypothetical protein [Saccharopolyspora oryzae]
MSNSPAGTVVSESVKQALFLRALASHLTANPDLCPVNVCDSLDRPVLQLRAWHSDDVARDLARWAESLPDSHLRVESIEGMAFVSVEAALFRHELSVWTTVPGLLEVLGDVDHFPPGKHPLALEVLRAYAGVEPGEAA